MISVSYEKGQVLEGGVVELEAAETAPPERYTEGTLISAMTSIHRFVKNEADRKVLRDAKGLGTERTRAPMIEKLKQVGYMSARKKGGRVELYPTDLGIELISKLPSDVELADPVMTAKWEMTLGLIEQGKITPQQADGVVRKQVVKIVEAMKRCVFDPAKLGTSAQTGAAGAAGSGKAAPQTDESIPGHGELCEKCRKAPMRGIRFASGKKKLSCSGYPACKNDKWVD